MRINKIWKKRAALAVVLCMTAGSLAGCGDSAGEKPDSEAVARESAEASEDAGEQGTGESGGNDAEDKAMGRYLEEDITLPKDCAGVEMMQLLDDGTMRIVYRGNDYESMMVDSGDKGQSWGEPVSIMELVKDAAEIDGLSGAALARDGGIFVSAVEYLNEEASEFSYHYIYISPDGQKKEIMPEGLTEADFVWSARFTDKGELLLNVTGNSQLLQVNPSDGSTVHSYGSGSRIEFFGATGNRLVVIGDGSIYYYDLETGKPLEEETALSQQISSNPENMEVTNSSSYPILFIDGDQADSMFYIDGGGVYRYAFGGTVVEKIIDGSLNSISSPGCQFVDFVRDEDGSFYLLAQNYDSADAQGRLYKYTYSPDTSAVPDTELKVYSLNDSSLMRQAAAVFQKKYPDIYLNVETGMTGDDAVTETDAIKTLNTEIMAGKGPDILIMDGIPENTYIEKGLLTDLSPILKDMPILENIKNAYQEEDGSIYLMPVKFGIPMIAGPKEELEKITDLKTLADVAEAHTEEYGERYWPLIGVRDPVLLIKTIADVCVPAWLTGDGTLDEAAVTEFLEQAGRIYQAGADGIKSYREATGDYPGNSYTDYQRQYYGVAASATTLLGKNVLVGSGGLYSPYDLAMLYSTEEAAEDIESKTWDGQTASSFIPLQNIGINAKSSQTEAAEKFVEFLFSDEGAQVGSDAGLPVNENIYDSLEYWNASSGDREVLSVFSSSNGETGEEVTLEVVKPDEETVKRIQETGKSLTVPSKVNEIILNAVATAGAKYLEGESSLADAAADAIRQVNLYLSE